MIVHKASKLGYKHYAELEISALDTLPLNSITKQIEYFLIKTWLREVFNIIVEVRWRFKSGNDMLIRRNKLYFLGFVDSDIDNKNYTPIARDTFEEAFKDGLEEGLIRAYNYGKTKNHGKAKMDL